MTFMRKRIIGIFGILALTLLLSACGSVSGSTKTIKIGYQKQAIMVALKENEAFIEELKEKGYSVTWSEFNTGSSILEALNAGSIDLANAGDMPTLFALAKGSDFKVIASDRSAPQTEAILVKGDSDIQSLEDLKGKKVAYNNASIAQYLLVKALDTVGLTIDDIESVILAPSDASIAFEKGDVDAWVTWDPYMTVAENSGNEILETGEGFVTLRGYFVSSTEIVENEPEVVETYIKYLKQIGQEINEDPTDAANLMEELTGVSAETWKTALARKDSSIEYINEGAFSDMEVQAQDLLEIGLIDQPINFDGKIWNPDE